MFPSSSLSSYSLSLSSSTTRWVTRWLTRNWKKHEISGFWSEKNTYLHHLLEVTNERAHHIGQFIELGFFLQTHTHRTNKNFKRIALANGEKVIEENFRPELHFIHLFGLSPNLTSRPSWMLHFMQHFVKPKLGEGHNGDDNDDDVPDSNSQRAWDFWISNQSVSGSGLGVKETQCH